MPFHADKLSKKRQKEIALLKYKKFRDEAKRYLIEGSRICREALAHPDQIIAAILCKDTLSEKEFLSWVNNCSDVHTPLSIVSQAEFNALANTKTPQGIAVIMQKQERNFSLDETRNAPLILALDGIGDPGNLGTIIRTADWFGCRSLLLSEDCVDIYNPKVIRSTMGSIFRISCFEGMQWSVVLPQLKEAGYKIIASAAGGQVELSKLGKNDKTCIIMGSEAHGLSQDAISLSDVTVQIPCSGQGESLNAAVAAAIFMYHFQNKANNQ